jgi:hypothetical protein
MKNVIGLAIAAIIFCAVLYGSYWLVKHGSYWLWYEDMVKATIREMVKHEALVKP